MKQAIFSIVFIFFGSVTNAQVGKQKSAINFDLDLFNKQNNIYISEQLKTFDTLSIKNKITVIKPETIISYSDSDLHVIIEKIKEYNSINVDNKFIIKRSNLDNMPIVVTTKSGTTYTIQFHKTTPKLGDAIPK